MSATAIADDVWTAREREAWDLGGDVLPSDWQDSHRVLTERMGAAEPGRMRTDRLPFSRGVLDSFVNPMVTDITVLSATQVFKTEMIITLLGFVVDTCPGNVLLAMPRKEDVVQMIRDRITPAFEESPTLARHFTGMDDDVAQKRLGFDRMVIYAGWAQSRSSLQSKPVPYYFGDELSEWAADRDDECVKRTGTHWNRKHFRTSTPRTDVDPIVLKWNVSLQHHFYVPCPHCRRYQVLVFPQIKWPKDAAAEPNRIDTLNLAWYECEHCKAKLRDADKRDMMLGGVWIPDAEAERFLELYASRLDAALTGPDRGSLLGGRTADVAAKRLDPDGEVDWTPPVSNHWGFQIAGWYAPWDSRRFSAVAREFIEANPYPAKLQVFRNKTQAMPWVEDFQAADEKGLARLIVHLPRYVVPADVQVLTAGADVHGDSRPIYADVVGWQAEDRCHLVFDGKFLTLDELGDALLDRPWTVEGTNRALRLRMLFIDCRYRLDEVYEWARQHPEQVRPVMGFGTERLSARWVVRYVDHHPRTGRPIKTGLKRVDVTVDPYKRDVLRHLQAEPGQPGSMTFHEDVSPEYRKHLAAEKLVPITDKRTGQRKYEWHQVGANHHFDSTGYAFVAADLVGARHLAPLGEGELPGGPKARTRFSDKLGQARRR